MRDKGDAVVLSGVPFLREGGDVQGGPGVASLGDEPAVLVNRGEGGLVGVGNGGRLPVAEGFLCEEEHAVRSCRRHNGLKAHGRPGNEMVRANGGQGCDLDI